MEITPLTKSTPQSSIDDALKKASHGHFYTITRHFIVKGNEGQLYDVSLNILERMMKSVLKLFGTNYLDRDPRLKDKKIEVLSDAEARLSVSPHTSQQKKAPVSSTTPLGVPGKPAPLQPPRPNALESPPVKISKPQTPEDIAKAAFNAANQITIALPTSDWSQPELTALTECMQKLNTRGRPGPFLYTFPSFSVGYRVADYLKGNGKISEFSFIPQTPKEFTLFVKKEDVPPSASPARRVVELRGMYPPLQGE